MEPLQRLDEPRHLETSSPYCNDDSIEPTEDWVEVHNTGSTPLNVSRWSVLNADGERRFMRLDSLWAPSNTTAKEVLNPGDRAVFVMDEYILTGLGDAFQLLHPDGDAVTGASWTVITDCMTLMQGEDANEDWVHALWPTPGEAEPNPADFATKEDLRFTRFMPGASTSISSDMEFIEVSNQGVELAVLNGWTLRTTTGASSTYNATITSLMIQPGESAILANDADALSVYEDGNVVDLAASSTGRLLPELWSRPSVARHQRRSSRHARLRQRSGERARMERHCTGQTHCELGQPHLSPRLGLRRHTGHRHRR